MSKSPGRPSGLGKPLIWKTEQSGKRKATLRKQDQNGKRGKQGKSFTEVGENFAPVLQDNT